MAAVCCSLSRRLTQRSRTWPQSHGQNSVRRTLRRGLGRRRRLHLRSSRRRLPAGRLPAGLRYSRRASEVPLGTATRGASVANGVTKDRSTNGTALLHITPVAINRTCVQLCWSSSAAPLCWSSSAVPFVDLDWSYPIVKACGESRARYGSTQTQHVVHI